MHTVRLIVAGLFVMLIGSSAWAAPCDGFTDVDSANATYCPAVTYLKNKGITLGCTGTTYCPNDFVTRLQMALFLQRMGRGGPNNVLGDWSNALGGGDSNIASGISNGDFNVVAGGLQNVATGGTAAVGGGFGNEAPGFVSTVGGGDTNIASGVHSTVPGGNLNTASGSNSFAAGRTANANRAGCFVWGDSSTDSVVSCVTALPNQFVARSVGGVYFLTAGTNDADYTGASLLPGAGGWTAYSDRNGKDNVEVVDPRAVLEHLVAMPVATWNWKSQDPSIRHMGPMAQDFAAAFNLGETPRGINTVDADGVALAAIQGLNAKLETQVANLTSQLSALAVELHAMKSGQQDPP